MIFAHMRIAEGWDVTYTLKTSRAETFRWQLVAGFFVGKEGRIEEKSDVLVKNPKRLTGGLCVRVKGTGSHPFRKGKSSHASSSSASSTLIMIKIACPGTTTR